METFLLQKFYDIVTEHFLNDLINETYVMEDGTIQNWVGNGLDKQEIKQQILIIKF